MKKSLGLAVLGLMFLAGPVFASGGEGDVEGGKTVTKIEGETRLDVSINQHANVKNDVELKENTGENVASKNSACCESEQPAVVSINTGSAEANVKIENDVNKAKVEVGEKEEEKEEEEKEEEEKEEGQSPAEVEVPLAASEGVAAAEVAGEVSGQLAAETLPETGANNVVLALLLSGILLVAGFDIKKFIELKNANLI